MAHYSWPVGTYAERQDTISRLLWVLYRHGGEVVNEDGRSVGVLLSLLADNGVEITGGYLNKTIIDLCKGGKFGAFLQRRVNGKRTYEIKLIRDPFTQPFPPDPWGEFDTDKPEPEPEAEAEVEVEEEEVVIEPDIDDNAHEDLTVAAIVDDEVDEDDGDVEDLDDLLAQSEAAATAATASPSTALDHLPEPGRTDKILYAISLLHDVLREDAERDVTAIVASQFSEFNRIAEENRELREQVEKLRGDKARLATALRQSIAVNQTAAKNGAAAGVPA